MLLIQQRKVGDLVKATVVSVEEDGRFGELKKPKTDVFGRMMLLVK